MKYSHPRAEHTNTYAHIYKPNTEKLMGKYFRLVHAMWEILVSNQFQSIDQRSQSHSITDSIWTDAEEIVRLIQAKKLSKFSSKLADAPTGALNITSIQSLTARN